MVAVNDVPVKSKAEIVGQLKTAGAGPIKFTCQLPAAPAPAPPPAPAPAPAAEAPPAETPPEGVPPAAEEPKAEEKAPAAEEKKVRRHLKRRRGAFAHGVSAALRTHLWVWS